MARWWRRTPRVAAGTAVVVLAAGLISGSGAMPDVAAGRSHAANTSVRHALDAAASRYHGVIGAPPQAVETDAQTPTQSVNVSAYQICANLNNLISHQSAAIYLAGWSGVSKLGGSVPLGSPTLGLARGDSGNEGLWVGDPVVADQNYNCATTLLQLDYRGQREFPPLTATFLAFGFMPVTATVYLTQAGPSPVTAVAYELEGLASEGVNSNTPFQVVSTAQVSLRLADVKVNGVPLDVGANCHTDGILTSPNPVHFHGLVLTGGGLAGDPLPQYISSFADGGMAGEATIPPFTGCVTPGGDNVDALLDASVSGPNNFVSLVTGPICSWSPGSVGGCAPASAPPFLPQFTPLWTVTHGGPYTATGAVSFNQVNPDNTTINCNGSEISGVIPDASGLLRSGALLGTLNWSFSDCTGSDGSTWTITQEGPAFLAGGQLLPIPGLGDVAFGQTEGLDLNLTGTNVPGNAGSCTAQVTYGIHTLAYLDASSTLVVLPGLSAQTTLAISKSNCADLPPSNEFISSVGVYATPLGITAIYSLPGGLNITSPQPAAGQKLRQNSPGEVFQLPSIGTRNAAIIGILRRAQQCAMRRLAARTCAG